MVNDTHTRRRRPHEAFTIKPHHGPVENCTVIYSIFELRLVISELAIYHDQGQEQDSTCQHHDQDRGSDLQDQDQYYKTRSQDQDSEITVSRRDTVSKLLSTGSWHH